MAGRMVLAVILAVGLVSAVEAQYGRDPYGRQQRNVQPVEIQGELRGIGQGGIMVIDGNGRTWRVVVLPATQVQVTGQTTPDCLRAGQIVEFTAEIDKHGKLKENVGQLNVISPNPQKSLGVFPVENEDSDQAAKPNKQARRSRGKIAPGKYRILGRLMMGRDHALSVQTGRSLIPFALADDPTIQVDMTDFSAVKPGCKISVQGMMQQNRPGIAQAVLVKATLPELPGSDKKDPDASPQGKSKPKS